MPISVNLRSLARTFCLAAPIAALAIPLSAAPVDILSASCAASSTAASPSDPSNCTGSTSEGHVTSYLQYFSNGFTFSVFANGTSWTSANQSGAFTLDAEVPVNVKIAGPSRNLVVSIDQSQTETLDAEAGTIGTILYGSDHIGVINQQLNGGDAVTFNYAYSSPTNVQTWTADTVAGYNFGLSMQLSSYITAGSLFGSNSQSETVHFFEADGVTPANLLVAQTPEPASLWLLLGGIPACYLVARKRRCSASVRS